MAKTREQPGSLVGCRGGLFMGLLLISILKELEYFYIFY